MPADLIGTLLDPQALPSTTILDLLGGPAVGLAGGAHRLVPEGSKRLLSFVALHTGQVDRRYTADVLWPVGNDERATGNLRSALWRLNRADIDVLVADKHSLALRSGVMIPAVTELAGPVVLITITLRLNGLLAGQGGIAPVRTARAAPLSG
jgi:hypothetical protein